MTRYVFKMPDLGEGTVEAEVVAWHIKAGDMVKEDQVMAEVMTDKAAVEVPAPVSGKVVTINGQPGDMIRVGAELVVFETESGEDLASAPSPAPAGEGRGEGREEPPPALRATSPAHVGEVKKLEPSPALHATSPAGAGEAKDGGRIKASPATRRKAREAGGSCRRILLPCSAARRPATGTAVPRPRPLCCVPARARTR
jgi:2-oxoisovalerate dehydrogenase E2 component (dihydrolipoyl transacylase)